MLLLYMWMAAQIPYTHDDWDWGLKLGMDHLLTADINSRYAGNLIVVLLTRIPALKTVFMGIVFTAIPASVSVLASKIMNTGKEEDQDLIRTVIFIFANIMILSMPKDVWRQTNGWTAGFSNFTVSALAMLLYFILIMKDPGKKILNCIGLFVFGVAIQLFLENLTVFFFLFSVFHLLIFRKIRQTGPLLLGNLTGLIIMFSSSIYSSLWNTGYAVGNYRHLMYDPSNPLHTFIFEAASRYLKEFMPQIISHHAILAGLIALLAAVRLFAIRRTASSIPGIINMLYFFYYIYSHIMGNPFRDTGNLLVPGLDCFFAVLMTVETVMLFRSDKRLLFRMTVLWLTPFIIVAPMLIINTAGPRTFYTTDICFTLFASILLSTVLTLKPKHKLLLPLIVCLIGLTVISIRWIGIYKPIGELTRERERLIAETIENGGKKITFREYPNSDYLWLPIPGNKDSWRYPCFKEFYHIPEDVDIEFEGRNRL